MLKDRLSSFDVFKCELQQTLTRLGEDDFVEFIMKERLISFYWEEQWYAECFYTLALLDCLCIKRNVPVFEGYSKLRKMSLKDIIFPQSILLIDKLNDNSDEKERVLEFCKNNIYSREFLKYNIVEFDAFYGNQKRKTLTSYDNMKK